MVDNVKNIDVLFTEEQIDARVRELGAQITRDYAGKEVKLICVLRGGSIFYAELAKRLDLPVRFDFISVSSYEDATTSSGCLKIRKALDEPVEGEHVIVVEDIIDSGRTLSMLTRQLKEQGAASVALATLLDKPSRRVVDVDVDYIGFEVSDVFVVGYGLDYAQYYRNLPYIGKVTLEE